MKNPSIACQYNNINNDSLNLTEVVLFDKYIPASIKYDINGFFNMKSTNTSHFIEFTLNPSSDSKQQTSINFNPFDSTFMVTYYNSTTQKLPFLLHNYNMLNADSWLVLNAGYNDSSDLANPFPIVALNFDQQQGANVWSAEGTGGNGIAMFDAPYSIYTGISENNITNSNDYFRIYPNPCNNILNISMELKNSENVTIIMYELLGKIMAKVTDQKFPANRNVLKYNVSDIPPGSYLLSIKTITYNETLKLLLMR